jgi:hypothetical protein
MGFILSERKRVLLTHSSEQLIGRWSELTLQPEVSNLTKDMDFREPRYRREVFLRFYEFHLKYKSHPGAVYFAFPWLADKLKMDMETKLWFAFINGCSQNIVTTYFIFQKYPNLKEVKLEQLSEWWSENQHKFKAGSGWDTDRKYFKYGKTGFPNCVASYKQNVDKFGSQVDMFNELNNTGDKFKNFEKTWNYVRANFMSFGRLSAFSYLEYLRIQGVNLDCNSLFLDDIDGSRSHRNGLCKVLGRDDLDWWKQDLKYNPETIEWLKKEGELLLEEAKARFGHLYKDVSYFTLESTFCCYKSWHRPNRRYPNVYMDMFHDRIRYAESEWGPNFDLFWEMRKDCLPPHLRQEDTPGDPGLSKEKQNHYLSTGQVIMMDKEWDCFENDFMKPKGIENFME